MVQINQNKEIAIKLRKKGFSYSEILKKVPVTKSTLSLWLRNVSLKKDQRQRLVNKIRLGQKKGARIKKEIKNKLIKDIKDKSRNEIGKLSNRELWLLGIALYWCEGNKEKDRSSLVRIGNSDPYLIKIFLNWLCKIIKINNNDIHFRIYLHQNSRNRLFDIQKYWSKNTGFPLESFQKISWKKQKISTNRKNINNDYYGLLSIIVRKSTNLNRKIAGWIEGIYQNY